MLRAGILLLGLIAADGGAQQSPYASMQSRSIKALSDDAVRDYLNGAGAGFALAAELNGYPGPKHILELGDQLKLTAEQRDAVTAVFKRMHDEAVKLGREIVEAEEALDAAFRDMKIRPELLQETTGRIAALQGRLRYAHLVAHLSSRQILTPEQLAEYARLRGYTDQQHHHGRHH